VNGFYKIMGDRLREEVHRQAAEKELALCKEKIASVEYDLIILE